ncbi:MAG: stage II sporulation protein M [Chloroflexi bacterium]|nr:stage II sporulation protein M [Chloroflexota bacterium]
MSPDELIAARRPAWERLAHLLKSAGRGRIASLSEAELVELGQLYRAATSDLAIAQRDFPRHDLAVYLNQLVGRAHPVVYSGGPVIWRQLWEFYRRGFPRLYRELAPFMLAAAVLFFGTGIVYYFVVLVYPDAASYALSPTLVGYIKSGHLWFKENDTAGGTMASLLMTNNIRVSFMAFAGGMLLGLFTVYVLIFNGLMLGGVLALMQVYGHAAPLWEFVIGHGVLELSELTMAGASGLMLGYAVLRPGLVSRRNALAVAAQRSVRLMLGSVPLLIVAGLIEGLLSPTDAPAEFKVAVGIGSGIVLYAYLFSAGRGHTNFSTQRHEGTKGIS